MALRGYNYITAPTLRTRARALPRKRVYTRSATTGNYSIGTPLFLNVRSAPLICMFKGGKFNNRMLVGVFHMTMEYNGPQKFPK